MYQPQGRLSCVRHGDRRSTWRFLSKHAEEGQRESRLNMGERSDPIWTHIWCNIYIYNYMYIQNKSILLIQLVQLLSPEQFKDGPLSNFSRLPQRSQGRHARHVLYMVDVGTTWLKEVGATKRDIDSADIATSPQVARMTRLELFLLSCLWRIFTWLQLIWTVMACNNSTWCNSSAHHMDGQRSKIWIYQLYYFAKKVVWCRVKSCWSCLFPQTNKTCRPSLKGHPLPPVRRRLNRARARPRLPSSICSAAKGYLGGMGMGWEVYFCDLCDESIPCSQYSTSLKTSRHQKKTEHWDD
jgi:hypothetical protein